MAELEAVLTANINKLKRQLAKAEKELSDYGKTAETTNRRVSGSFTKATNTLNTQNQKVSKGFKGSSAGAVEFGRLIGDLPFGIQGVANNIQQLAFVMGGGAALQIGLAAVTSLMLVLERQGISLGGVLTSLTGSSKTLADSQKQAAVASKEFVGSARAEISELQILLGVARDEEKSKLIRERAIKRINDKYGDYLGNLSTESINTDKVTNSINRLNDALLNEAKIRGIRSVIEEKFGKIAERIAKNESAFRTGASTELREQNKILSDRKKALEQTIPSVQKAAKEDENAAVALSKLQTEYDSIIKKLSGEGQVSRREGIVSQLIQEDSKQAEREIERLQQILKPLLEFDLLNGTSNKIGVTKGLGKPFLGNLKVTERALDTLTTKFANSPFRTGFFKAFEQPLVDGVKNIPPRLSNIEKRYAEFNDKMSNLTIDLSGSITSGFATIGQSLANGANLFGAVGQALLQTMGSIAVELGKASIAAGVAGLALKNLFKSPFAAIAAGGALVAIGSALSSARGAVSGIGGGGSIGGQGSASFSGSSGSTSFSNGGFNGRVVFEISGQKLIGVLNNSLSANQRLGGNLTVG